MPARDRRQEEPGASRRPPAGDPYTPRPFPRAPVTSTQTAQLRTLRSSPCRPRQDHAGRPAPEAVGHARCRKVHRSGDGLERARARARHHILAKNTAILWNGYRINIVDTPGTPTSVAKSSACCRCGLVLLLVDAVDGPMPQTRFVTQKAFAHGLRPIVVINKIDRHEARPTGAGPDLRPVRPPRATEAQLDFPVIYTSAIQGFSSYDPRTAARHDDAVRDHRAALPAARRRPGRPLQLQVSQLDYSSYVGAIASPHQAGKIARA